MKNFYRKLVIRTTVFLGGVSCIFLISGAGIPGLRLLVWVIFLICFINLSIYTKEFLKWSREQIQNAAAVVAEKTRDGEGKPSGDGDRSKPGGSKDGGSKDGGSKDGDGKGGGSKDDATVAGGK